MVKKGVHFSMKSALGLLQYLGGGGGSGRKHLSKFLQCILGYNKFSLEIMVTHETRGFLLIYL